MRTIEEKIFEAFKAGKALKLTKRDAVELDGAKVVYRLWGSAVFSYDKERDAFFFSFCGWPSITTKSRIHALLRSFGLGGVRQKNYRMVWFWDGGEMELDDRKIYEAKRSGSGLSLAEA